MKQMDFTVAGNKLKGTLIFPKPLKQKNPAILFVHGWTSQKERSYQYANALARLGYISYLFDMRGHGGSEGSIENTSTKEFLDDVLAAYDFFVNLDPVDKQNISVVGSSYGSYLGALLSSKRNVRRLALRVPADYPNDSFNKPKLLTSGTDNPEIVAWRSQTRTAGQTYALDAISGFGGEILIIESEKDIVVPHETVQNYANAVRNKSKLTHIVVKNAPHSIKEGPFRDEVERIIIHWFKKYITP